MFPPELSDGVFSLVDGEVHSTITFVATLAADGTMLDYDVQPGRVRCTRVTYDDADSCLSDPSKAPSADVFKSLKVRPLACTSSRACTRLRACHAAVCAGHAPRGYRWLRERGGNP